MIIKHFPCDFLVVHTTRGAMKATSACISALRNVNGHLYKSSLTLDSMKQEVTASGFHLIENLTAPLFFHLNLDANGNHVSQRRIDGWSR